MNNTQNLSEPEENASGNTSDAVSVVQNDADSMMKNFAALSKTTIELVDEISKKIDNRSTNYLPFAGIAIIIMTVILKIVSFLLPIQNQEVIVNNSTTEFIVLIVTGTVITLVGSYRQSKSKEIIGKAVTETAQKLVEAAGVATPGDSSKKSFNLSSSQTPPEIK